jgi:hypothetical protein
MKTEKAYHKNSNVVKWKRITHSNGLSSEYTYNEQGEVLTYEDSSGYYEIKCKKVTKEEFEAFVNDDIIELNGVKYKRI